MRKDLQNVRHLTKFHTGAAERKSNRSSRDDRIGYQALTDDALRETQVLDKADESKSIFKS